MKEFVLKGGSGKKTSLSLEKTLNTQQQAVVREGDGPCLVLAGAGSGKTRTITYRVAYLLEQGVAPESILLLTFTNKAAQEMLHRVEALVGAPSRGVFGGTFHSVASRFLRMFGASDGISQSFTILDADDTKALLKACIRDVQVDTSSRRFPSVNVVRSMLSYRQNACMPLDRLIEDRYDQFAHWTDVISRIEDLYQARKRQSNALDFDDLLIRFVRILEQQPHVRERLSNQFQYILVDEYQDTNAVQAKMVDLLSQTHKNILVVGDDAQSIYSFRAADIQNILSFPRRYPNAKTFHLTANYRSAPEILQLANQSINHNTRQFQKELEAVCVSTDLPSVVPAANNTQEAQYIAEQMLTLQEEGMSLDEMAVLFRASFHSQALEFELMKRDIPYEYRGGLKFFERAHVKDVIAFIRLKANIRDVAAWLRLLPQRQGIGPATAQKIINQLEGVESFEDVLERPIKLSTRAEMGWRKMLRMIRPLVSASTPGELVHAVVNGKYADYLESEYQDAADRLEDLEQFALFADGYDEIMPFLDEVSLTSDYGARRQEGAAESEERVILSTIHQAKGLEWDAVFIMHLIDGKFPNQRALAERDGVEEERRLFYVATTRARKRLFCTYPLTIGYDAMRLQQPSVFLQELPESLFERVQLRQSFSRGTLPDPDEPAIVLDEMGERTNRTAPPSSFLRDFNN